MVLQRLGIGGAENMTTAEEGIKSCLTISVEGHMDDSSFRGDCEERNCKDKEHVGRKGWVTTLAYKRKSRQNRIERRCCSLLVLYRNLFKKAL
jgi:hypothetical protein